MAGNEEDGRTPVESWPDNSRPVIGNQVPSGDPAAPAYGYPTARPDSDIEDERAVPKWPYVVGAALLLVIPLVVLVAILLS